VTNSKIRQVQASDEVLMGMGLLMFVIALSILSLKEFNRLQLQKEIENRALNLLKTGQANVGAMVDQIIERGLLTQGLPVSAQIFKDYHGDLLERMSYRSSYSEDKTEKVETKVEVETVESQEYVEPVAFNGPKTNFKEVLLSIQNINAKDLIQVSDVRDVQLAVGFEGFEQLMNAAVNKLASRRNDNKKIIISNQIHSDRAVINLFMAGNTFTATELDFSQNNLNTAADTMDMNMVLLKEMANETNTTWHMENKTDRAGVITGMAIRFTMIRVPRDAKSNKNLVSVVKGKKKDMLGLMN
jgi:hypothetical protein